MCSFAVVSDRHWCYGCETHSDEPAKHLILEGSVNMSVFKFVCVTLLQTTSMEWKGLD